ncbi:MAG: 50S ribosomal protein L22 [Candidatus Yanofskybacteria bacterium CG10_big_fil_rev_8_21_14_0_10_37_15]|uniref:Large ribosomal subunit protein uL22 n=1 Tax=Candidatus Yanofskybacteria bacterium CG10_big_fil_rev_8_21_14_0_10_37_15 TaxID=1975097 RepID=A0A2H0R7M8_9BACT|nr:MAG: 50S ribosomal protein L22 [Candidatus Yanofskybacteria bacterium CG10_big_fil_rev_8_21_14_0_10_37_15]
MATIKAQLNGLRIAPRKVRILANLVKGKGVNEALGQLEFYVKKSSPSLIKLVNSAIANAENTHHMVRDNLYIKDFLVDEGVKLKRFKPKGFGRVSPLQKKTSLIKLVLAERIVGMKKQAEQVISKKEEIHEHAEKEKRPEMKTEIGKKTSGMGFAKRIFRRKQV